MPQHEPIPQEWIKSYVDTLLEFANKAGPGTAMADAAALRAEHAMDLVKAYRTHLEENANARR